MPAHRRCSNHLHLFSSRPQILRPRSPSLLRFTMASLAALRRLGERRRPGYCSSPRSSRSSPWPVHGGSHRTSPAQQRPAVCTSTAPSSARIAQSAAYASSVEAVRPAGSVPPVMREEMALQHPKSSDFTNVSLPNGLEPPPGSILDIAHDNPDGLHHLVCEGSATGTRDLLAEAASKGNSGLICSLLESQNADGHTALHLACRRG